MHKLFLEEFIGDLENRFLRIVQQLSNGLIHFIPKPDDLASCINHFTVQRFGFYNLTVLVHV